LPRNFSLQDNRRMKNQENQTGLTRRREARESNVEELSAMVVDAAFHLHRDMGPGIAKLPILSILSILSKKSAAQPKVEGLSLFVSAPEHDPVRRGSRGYA
jgi:hypothetical protein